MPLNCPLFTSAYLSYFARYNACLGCGKRHENECWADLPIARSLSDILTIEERVAILEDRKEVPPVNIVTMSRKDYQQLQRLLLLLEERINSHIDRTEGNKDYQFK